MFLLIASGIMFCFPCILLSPRDNGDYFWTLKEVNDIKHLTEQIKKHEISVHHMNSVVDFSLSSVDSCLLYTSRCV